MFPIFKELLQKWRNSRSVFWLFLIQVEGKGNGIKTVIVNMVDVAKALNRPPTCKCGRVCLGRRSKLVVAGDQRFQNMELFDKVQVLYYESS